MFRHNFFTSKMLSALINIAIFMCVFPGTSLGNETSVRLNPGSVLTLPMRLNQQQTIESIDVSISGYDSSVIELTEVGLTDGIFDNGDYDYTLQNNIRDDMIGIVIFTGGMDHISASGDVAFLSFTLKDAGETTLSVSKFQCNESSVSGGFYLDEAIFSDVRIVVNQKPVADEGNLGTDEDTLVNAIMSASDGNEDALIYTIVTEPEKGIVEITDETTGEYTYTPNENANGSDSFTFTASDGVADSDPAEISILANPINDAPVLADGLSPMLSEIVGDDAENQGNSVAELIAADSITDADISEEQTVPTAIAVTGADNTRGVWEYSTDNGGTWMAFGENTGETQARLLDEVYRIRFVPSDVYMDGTSAFTFRAWDKTEGAAGETTDASQGGGDSAFSESSDTAEIRVIPANHAPVLNATTSLTLSDIVGHELTNQGNMVAEIIADAPITDADIASGETVPQSIAVTAADNTRGTWEYSADDGETWSPFSGGYMSSEARLLDETHRIRFVPADIYMDGTAAISFRAWDETEGMVGETADAVQGGTTSSFSKVEADAMIRVIPANHAPELSAAASPMLSDIISDDFDNAGNSVAEIVADGSVTDADFGDESPAPEAIAVTAVEDTDGTWQYSFDDGQAWTNLADTDLSAEAILLDETARIRFAPAHSKWAGTVTFTFRAWDKTVGETGGTADASAGGGISAFSAISDEAAIEVIPANIAPELDTGASPVLSELLSDDSENQGDTVGEIVEDESITDADVGEDGVPPKAIAVTAVDNTNGRWQYSFDAGKSWTDFTAKTGGKADLSEAAVLLDKSHRIRFVPAQAEWSGTASLRFRAWDKSEGNPGDRADVSGAGGFSAFSENEEQALIKVTQANHAPELDSGLSIPIVWMDTPEPDGRTLAEIIPDDTITDADAEEGETPPKAIAVVSVDNTEGVWQYSLNDGETWADFTSETGNETDLSGEARLLDEMHRIRFQANAEWSGTAVLTFRAWDKYQGYPGETADASEHGGVSSFSKEVGEIEIMLRLINDPPMFQNDSLPDAEEDAEYFQLIRTEDPDAGDMRTISAPTLPAWLSLTDKRNGSATLTGTPGNDDVGEHEIELQVTDMAGESDIRTFEILVTNTEDSPAFTSTPVTNATQDMIYNYEVTAADPDAGDTLAITATMISGWLTLTDNGDGTATLTGIPGNTDTVDHQTELLVTDASGATDTQSFAITVANVNETPIFGDGDLLTRVTEGEAYTQTLTAKDNDIGDKLAITAVTLPSWLRLEDGGDGTASLSGTPGKDDAGDHIVELRVEDTAGDSDTLSFTISVENFNDVPVIEGQNPLSVTERMPLTIYLRDLKVSDLDNDFPDDFTLTVHDGENFDREGNTVTPSPGFTGTLTIPVSVSDGSDESERFYLNVAVVAETIRRSINGTIIGLGAGEKVRVRAFSPSNGDDNFTTLEGTGGRLSYQIGNLPPAVDYHATIIAEGYYDQAYDGRASVEDADLIDLSYEGAAGIDFTLAPFQEVIAGRVIFPEGASSGETVRIETYSPSQNQRGDTTAVLQSEDDLEVPYEIGGLTVSDDYIVSVWSDQYKNRYYDGTEIGASLENDAKSVDTDTPDAKNIIFRLEKGAALSGALVGAGEDMEGMIVEATDSNGLTRTAIVSEDGSFVIEGLDSDSVTLVARKPGVAPFFFSSEGIVRDSALATPVNIQDDMAQDIEISIPESESITGVIRDENGEPLSGVWVSVWSETTQTGNSVFTREDGTYEIEGLPESDDYEVSASLTPNMPAETTDAVTSGSSGANITLNPNAGFMISGTILDEYGDHVANANIEIWSDTLNFQGWNEESPESGHGQVLGAYEIRGLPAGDDYTIQVRPPEDSPYALFKEKNIAISEDTVLDIVLEPAAKITGKIEADEGENVKGIRILVVSEETGFQMEVLTDENGFYEVPNVPEASDYVIMPLSDDHTSQEMFVGFGDIDAEIILTLDSGGDISGEIRDKITQQTIQGAIVTARSESMGDEPNYSAMAVSDEQGQYAIAGLRTEFDDGTRVSDYVLTVNSGDYPLHAEIGKAVGDEVSFLLDRGSDISGRVTNFTGNADEALVLDIFEYQGDFIKSITIGTGGSFLAPGLSSAMRYQLRFTTYTYDGFEILVQWAGEGDVGFDDPDPYADQNPDNAKVYDVGSDISFRFGESSGSRSARKRRTSRSDAENSLELRSPTSEIVSRNPEITVKWESTSEISDEKYYYMFNEISDHRITKRNAPRNHPIGITRATSRKLSGDNDPYHFHVAPVDRRGRIGNTASLGFRIDTVPPSNAMAIAPPFTSVRDILLTLGASGVSEMFLSNTDYGVGGKWEKWDRTRLWTLTGGEGRKRVFVQFRDRAGNTANALALTEMVAAMPDEYLITATAGKNGIIIPSGEVAVYSGKDVKFTFSPDDGYEVDEVFANGQSVTPEGNTHTFRNVSADGSVSVTFRQKSLVTHVITATSGPGGSITPSGEVLVAHGEGISFFVTPDAGYETDAVFLDGRKVRLRDEDRFDFINADRDYALSVTFRSGK